MKGPLKVNAGSAFVTDFILAPAPKTRAAPQAWSKKRPFYKPLPTQFRRNGLTYRQIARKGNAALDEQRWTGCVDPSVCYEVIRIRCREGFQIGDRFVGPAEIYPKPQSWGVNGFTVIDRDAAFAKLNGRGGK